MITIITVISLSAYIALMAVSIKKSRNIKKRQEEAEVLFQRLEKAVRKIKQ